MTIVFLIFIVLAIFVVSYSLSVIVHELSHLTAAILCKQRPKFFLVGFSKSRFNCLFSFNLFDVITPLKNKHKLINLHTAPLDV